MLTCLVNQYSEICDLVSCLPFLLESCLFICFGLYLDPFQYDPKKDLASMREASIVLYLHSV